MISNTQSKALYTGNGVATQFAFSFKVWETDQVLITVTDADGRETDVTSQCSVSLTDSGGTVTYNPSSGPLPAGHKLAISRSMPFLQEDQYITGTRFDPHEIEDALDIACAERQELREIVSRAILLPITSDEDVSNLYVDFLNAVDKTEEHMNQAGLYAAQAGQAVILGTHAQNVEATWVVDQDIESGTVLILPITYFPGRAMLHMSYDGVEMYQGVQYEEIGGKDELSSSVRILFPLSKGMVMHAWAIASNLIRQVEVYEAQAKESADRAKAEADRAESSVAAAVTTATADARQQAALATEQASIARAEADRAKSEADRAAADVQQATTQAIAQTSSDAERAKAEADRAQEEADKAVDAANTATSEADRARETVEAAAASIVDQVQQDADRAKEEADRASLTARLGNSINLEATWALDEAISAGGVLTLPEGLLYWPGMSMIRLSHDGVAMYPGAQFEEIVEDGQDTSRSVRVFLALKQGAVVNCWIAANVGKSTNDALAAATDALTAAETARQVAQDAAAEATEQADRADDAAIDASQYRQEALEAAKCAKAAIGGRSVAALLTEDLLEKVPSGFFVINENIVLPGTIPYPLTPVEDFTKIPNMDGFYLFVPVFQGCPPTSEPDTPQTPDEPENPEDPGADYLLPCGRRLNAPINL